MRTILKRLLGSESLSKTAAFLKEWWTSEASLMCSLPISPASSNAISLPVSADGRMPCGSQESQMMSPSGPEAAHALHSQPQEKRKSVRNAEIDQSRIRERLVSLLASSAGTSGSQMVATCGLSFTDSSISVSLQQFLENKLRARMERYGSPEYELRWKSQNIVLGPAIFALRGLARRKSASVFGGWPTPMAGAKATENYNEAGNTDSSRKTVALVGWNTPRATDGSNGGPNQAGGALPADAALAGWPPPTAGNAMNGNSLTHKTGNFLNLSDAAALGICLVCSPAQMEKRGALNPAHSRWLMGYPVEWDSCGATAMQSCRKSPRSSSKRSTKPCTMSDPMF